MQGATIRLVALATAVLLAGLATGCASSSREPRRPKPVERGTASWYGPGFHGNRTANGEIYDMHDLTAAHKTLPFDTLVEVRSLDNGRTVTVRINDRGPFIRGRVIDLSLAAAQAIGMVGPGTARVELTLIGSAGGAGSEEAAGRLFVVQAGAFRDRSKAEDLVREIRKVYPGTTIESSGGWHRVVVGRFKKRKEAAKCVEKLGNRGYRALVRTA